MPVAVEYIGPGDPPLVVQQMQFGQTIDIKFVLGDQRFSLRPDGASFILGIAADGRTGAMGSASIDFETRTVSYSTYQPLQLTDEQLRWLCELAHDSNRMRALFKIPAAPSKKEDNGYL